MSEESLNKILKTRFQKGNLPHNTLKDGAISTRKDKRGMPYKFIRVEKAKWLPLHVHIWEQANGIIPKGNAIVFKDNNTMNCQLSNLECISRVELMKRNTIHRYPNELKQTLKLLKNVKSKLESSK